MDKGLNVIADHYGTRPQLAQLQEECAELIVACSKVLRYGYSDQASEELTEELADVEIMCQQIRYLFGCNKEVDSIKENKIRRKLERISKEV